MMRPYYSIAAVFLMFLAGAAHASQNPGSDKSAKSGSSESEWGRPFAELQFSGVAGGSHESWRAGFDFALSGGRDGFEVSVIAPIRFDPDGFRMREWDEPNDFGRLLSRFGWTDRTGRFDVSIKPVQNFNLGMGNLVSMFNGVIDGDHFRTGVSARLHWDVAGGDLFLDGVAGPSVIGGRVYFRPLWFVDRSGQVGRLEIGASFAGDINAPSNMGASTPENPTSSVPGPNGLVATDPSPLTAWSIDVSWPVRPARAIQIKPWASWSRIGWSDASHVGLELAFNIRSKVVLTVTGRYDFMESGFVTGYFDNVYMADRYDFNAFRDAAEGPVSKRVVTGASRPARHGGAFGMMAGWDPWLTAWIGADVDQYGAFSRIRAGLTVKVPDRLLLTGTVYARGFGVDGRQRLADRIFCSVAADVTVWKYIGVFALYSRDLFVPDSGSDRFRYVSGNTGLAGVRFSFGLLKD
ncbi:MAG TPA: hypothetical protein PLC24_05880 [Myxococcota bacterium]|nr:hypothetical protein [Myxococcota bacterium]